MSVDFDDQIRSALAATRHQAPSPIAWSDVLARSAASPSTTKSPTMPTGRGRLLMAAAAGLVLVLIAGLAVIGNDGSNIDPATTTPPTPPPTSPPTSERSLADIEPRENAAPTVIPADWTIEPLFDGDELSWNFIDTASGRRGTVQITGARDSSPGNETVGIAGIDWEILESVPALRATFDEVTVVVLTSDFALDEIEPLLAGLRPGSLDEHPGGVFKVRNIGTEFAATESGTLRAVIVNGRLCWAFFGLDGSENKGCQLDPFAVSPPHGVALDDGVAVLTQFDTQVSGDGRWTDTVIGVTRNDIDAVELEYTDGDTVTVATADPRDQLGVRLFAADKAFVRTDEASPLVSVSAITPEDPHSPIPTLQALEPGEILIPSFIPDGWDVTPAIIDRGTMSWQFSDPGRASGSISVCCFGPDGLQIDPGSAATEDWNIQEIDQDSLRFNTQVAGTQVSGFAFGFPAETVTDFVAGLQGAAPGEHPAGFFDTANSGAVVQTADLDLTVRFAQVDDALCWSVASTIGAGAACSVDLFAASGPEARNTDEQPVTPDGVAVLELSWTSVPANNTDPNAAIVTSIVRLMGVTEPSMLEVTIVSPDGAVFIAPTADVPDRPDLRVFALQLVVDGGDFSPDQIRITR